MRKLMLAACCLTVMLGVASYASGSLSSNAVRPAPAAPQCQGHDSLAANTGCCLVDDCKTKNAKAYCDTASCSCKMMKES